MMFTDKIGKTDLACLSLLKALCERAENFLDRVVDGNWLPILDDADSPKENLTDILHTIGIVSTWVSPDFKMETQTQMAWGCLGKLAYSRGDDCYGYAYTRWNGIDIEIARNDIRVLSELCGHWLKTGKATAPVTLTTRGVW